MIDVQLRSAAWYGDERITVRFPDDWDVSIFGPQGLSPLAAAVIRQRLSEPIGAERLSILARGRRRAVIVVDDITRPTPAADLLPTILDELAAGGISRDAVSVVLAVGAHKHASPDHVQRKLGPWASALRVVPHNCTGDLVDLGRTARGSPISVNRWVMECDLKIGVGGVYPHSDAGFSGGSKIVVPGVCGVDTARYLHQNLLGAGDRGGPLQSEFRHEVDEIATRIGLDFVINAVVDSDRRVAAVFAGNKLDAFHRAVECAAAHYTVDDVDVAGTADVIVADTYPFDTSLMFACSKGTWPLVENGTGAGVALAACPLGFGHHELSSLSLPRWKRLARRVRYLRPRQLPRLARKVQGIRRSMRRRRMPVLVLSPQVGTEDVIRIFPNGQAFKSWDALLAQLQARHARARLRVAVYRCAPLLVRRRPAGLPTST